MPWLLFALLLLQQPAFEVASVKPTTGRTHAVGTLLTYPGGRLTAEGCTLEYLVQVAFDVQRFQISGGPDWIISTDSTLKRCRRPSRSQGSFDGNGIAGVSISMPLFVARLSRWLDRPVFDRTGLDGSFDFKVLGSESGDTKVELNASLVTLIQALGLKLESAIGSVVKVVIDSAARPSEN